jgi:hypothetical protein
MDVITQAGITIGERERDQRGKERQKEYFYRHVGLEEKKIQAENSFHPFRN